MKLFALLMMIVPMLLAGCDSDRVPWSGDAMPDEASSYTITTIAGTDPAGGDGGPATEALLTFPFSAALDSQGHLYIADTENNLVRKVDAESGVITTFAGTGEKGFGGDGGPATEAKLDWPTGVAVDSAGNVYIADREK